MKLYSVQPFTSERKYRKSLMRVYIRIPMSGEVLTYRKHAATFQTGSISYHFIRYPHRSSPTRVWPTL